MAIKGVSVDLEDSLHLAVKAAAAIRKQSVPEAYTEALDRWLKWINSGAEHPSALGSLTTEEKDTLEGVLHFLRTEPEDSMNVWLQWVSKQKP